MIKSKIYDSFDVAYQKAMRLSYRDKQPAYVAYDDNGYYAQTGIDLNFNKMCNKVKKLMEVISHTDIDEKINTINLSSHIDIGSEIEIERINKHYSLGADIKRQQN